MSMIHCGKCEHLIDSDDDPDCFVSLDDTLCEWCREEAEIDPHEDCSANMLRDLHRIKKEVARPEMRAALEADLKEYDYLLTRIQLELSVLTPPKLKMVSNNG